MADLGATVAVGGNVDLRRRLTPANPLYSQDVPVQHNEATGGEEEPESSTAAASKDATSAVEGQGQVREVTENMFSAMVDGLDEACITKENVDIAVQNLFTNLLNPSQSLVQAEDYAKSAQGTKGTLKKLLLDAIHRSTTHKVDYELFSSVVLRCIQGKMSLFDLRNISIEHRELITEQRHASIGKLLTDPTGTMKKLYQSTLQWIERQGVKWLWSSFSTKQLYWLVAAYILPMLTVSVIVSSISTALFAGAVIAMVLTTIEIAVDNQKIQFQTEYVSLLQYFNNSSEAIRPRVANSMLVKYANFIMALVVALISLEFSYIHPVFYSLLFIASAVAVIFVTLQYDLHEHPVFFYFCVAKLPELVFATTLKIYQYTPFLQYLEFLYTSFYVLPLSDEFSVHLDLVTLLQVSVHLYSLIVCLRKYGWSDVKGAAGPLVLLGCWYAVLRYFLAQSSPKYIFFIMIGSIALSVIPYIMALFFLVSPVGFFYVYRFTPPFYYSCGFIMGAFVIFTIVAFSWKKFPYFWLNLTLDYTFLMTIVIAVPVTVYLSSWYISIYAVAPLPHISMDDYSQYCSPRLYEYEANAAQTQINCLHMQDRVLSGEGTMTSVRISQMEDKKSASLRFLPTSLQKALTCVLGERQPMCGKLHSASTCVFNGCHFQSSLQYSFEVKMNLRLASPDDLISAKLSVPDRYRELMLSLGRGSVIRFNASIVEGMGTDSLVLQTLQVSMTDGIKDFDKTDMVIDDNKETVENFVTTFLKALRSILIIVIGMLFGLFH